MGPHLRTLIVMAVLALAGCQKAEDPAGRAGWELKPLAPNAAPFTAKEKMPGLYPTGSRIKDPDALGGFGPCDNYPKDISGQKWGTNGAVSVVAFLDEPVAYFEHSGFALRVVNRTAEATPFAAGDSMLSLVREAQDSSGVWREIETLPETSCGNSFHRVFLGSMQYWEFPARLYSGPIKTKMRFRLDPGDGKPAIYSDEFDGQVTVAQLADG